MSDMKCPFCGQKLDTDYHYISCRNPHCNITVDMDGTEELWKALIRTRKVLDVAKERLKNIILDAEVLATPEYLASRAKETLDEITALEQKDK